MLRCTARSMNRVAFTLVSMAFAVPAQAVVIYADSSAPLGGDGQSWTTAFRRLQDAMAYAAIPQHGVTLVRVGDGSHAPDLSETSVVALDDPSASFQMRSGLRIEGGYDGYGSEQPDVRDTLKHRSFLSGGGTVRAYHVVTAIGTDASAVLDGFTIRNGRADGTRSGQSNGGGIYIVDGAPTIVNCLISDNEAAHDGGGVYSEAAAPTFINCLLDENQALRGGGMNIEASSATTRLINCTITNNSSIVGTAVRTFGRATELISGIVWGNSGGPTIEGPHAVTYSLVQGGWPGVGNINEDPLLTWSDVIDFYVLAPNSPCIDKGNSDAVPKSVTGDLINRPRFSDEPDVTDCPVPGTDCGGSPVVDMGAFESLPSALKSFNGDSTLEGGWDAFDQVQPHGRMTQLLTGLPDLTSFTEFTTSLGPIDLGFGLGKFSVSGGTFPAWSHDGPVGDEVYMGEVELTMPPGIGAFDLYLSPLTTAAGIYEITATPSAGNDVWVVKTITGPLDPEGGPSHVGFYVDQPGVTIKKVTIDAATASPPGTGLAVAELRYAAAVPEPDLDGDRTIDGFDLAILLGAWGSCPVWTPCQADLNFDGVVNGFDLAILLGAWG